MPSPTRVPESPCNFFRMRLHVVFLLILCPIFRCAWASKHSDNLKTLNEIVSCLENETYTVTERDLIGLVIILNLIPSNEKAGHMPLVLNLVHHLSERIQADAMDDGLNGTLLISSLYAFFSEQMLASLPNERIFDLVTVWCWKLDKTSVMECCQHLSQSISNEFLAEFGPRLAKIVCKFMRLESISVCAVLFARLKESDALLPEYTELLEQAIQFYLDMVYVSDLGLQNDWRFHSNSVVAVFQTCMMCTSSLGSAKALAKLLTNDKTRTKIFDMLGTADTIACFYAYSTRSCLSSFESLEMLLGALFNPAILKPLLTLDTLSDASYCCIFHLLRDFADLKKVGSLLDVYLLYNESVIPFSEYNALFSYFRNDIEYFFSAQIHHRKLLAILSVLNVEESESNQINAVRLLSQTTFLNVDMMSISSVNIERIFQLSIGCKQNGARIFGSSQIIHQILLCAYIDCIVGLYGLLSFNFERGNLTRLLRAITEHHIRLNSHTKELDEFNCWLHDEFLTQFLSLWYHALECEDSQTEDALPVIADFLIRHQFKEISIFAETCFNKCMDDCGTYQLLSESFPREIMPVITMMASISFISGDDYRPGFTAFCKNNRLLSASQLSLLENTTEKAKPKRRNHKK